MLAAALWVTLLALPVALVAVTAAAAGAPQVWNCWGGGRCNDKAVPTEAVVCPMHFGVNAATGWTVVADTEGKQIREERSDGIVRLVATTANPPMVAEYAPGGEIVYGTNGGLLFYHDAVGEHAINSAGLKTIADLAVCDDGLWVADQYFDSGAPQSGGVFRLPWPPSGGVPVRIVPSGLPASGAPVWMPQGVACGANRSLLIADTANNRVRRRAENGTLATIAGPAAPDASGRYPRGYAGDGGPASGALFNGPLDIAEAPDGAVFIADYSNHRVRKVDAAGIINTVLGTGGVNSANVDPQPGQSPTTFPATQPIGVALAGSTLKVSSAYDRRIRCVTDMTGPPISPLASATLTATATLLLATFTPTRAPLPTSTATPLPTCARPCI